MPKQDSRPFLSRDLGSAVAVSTQDLYHRERLLIVVYVTVTYPVRTKLYNIRLPLWVLPELCMRDSAAEGISIL
jgi:hypothetical protein